MLTPLSKNRLKFLYKLKQKKYRDSENLFLISGLRAVQSVLDNPQAEYMEAIISQEKITESEVLFKNSKPDILRFSISVKDFAHLVDEKTPQGICLLARKPVTAFDLQKVSGDLVLFLDRVNDPGNLGTIIRSAVWFGCKTIILSRDSVDPFQQKVVRASAGTLLNITILENTDAEDLKHIKEQMDYRLLATDIRNGININNGNFSKKSIIMMGSEAHGLSPHYLSLCDEKITIPGYGDSESLNLANAAAIIMYQVVINQQSSTKNKK